LHQSGTHGPTRRVASFEPERPVRTLLIANPKGGSGKTTLAINLAGCLAARGHDVVLGDIDRQESTLAWMSLRPPELPPIGAWEIERDDIERPPRGTDFAVLDTPAGLRGKVLDKVVKLSARVIVPVQPSLFDMLATKEFIDALLEEKAVRNGRTDIAVIGMRVDARTRSAAELERFLEDIGLPVLAYLRDTQLYVQTAAQGMTLFDLPPSRVERDLEQWQPIIDWAES
jgi:chromosome partitioning protein